MTLGRRDRERLIEATVSAYRPERTDCRLGTAPSWHDLDAAGRAQAFDETLRQRELDLRPLGISFRQCLKPSLGLPQVP